MSFIYHEVFSVAMSGKTPRSQPPLPHTHTQTNKQKAVSKNEVRLVWVFFFICHLFFLSLLTVSIPSQHLHVQVKIISLQENWGYPQLSCLGVVLFICLEGGVQHRLFDSSLVVFKNGFKKSVVLLMFPLQRLKKTCVRWCACRHQLV